MPKIVVNCIKCSFSFLSNRTTYTHCPACGARLRIDSDGCWRTLTPDEIEMLLGPEKGSNHA